MFRFIPQLEHSDCGIACIRMVARHYGLKVSSFELEKHADCNRLGMSVSDIANCLSYCNISSVAVKLDKDVLGQMPLPAICHWNGNHFVVLHKISKSGKIFHLADPSKGKYRVEESDFIKHWIPEGEKRGMVILAEPDGEFKPSGKLDFSLERELLRYVKPLLLRFKWKYSLAVLLALVITGCDMCFPFLVKEIFDKAIPLQNTDVILIVMLAQAAVLGGRAVSSLVVDIAMTKMGLKMNLEMATAFVAKLLSYPVSYFNRKVSSDFIQKLEDQGRIKDFIVSFPSTIIVTMLSLLVFSVLLLYFSPTIFMCVIVFAAFEIGWTALFNERRRGLDYRMFQSRAQCRNHAFETGNGIEEIKINNAGAVRLDEWKDLQRELNTTTIKSKWTNVWDSTVRTMLVAFKEIVVSGLSAYFVIKGQFSLGTMMTAGYIVGRLSSPFSTLANSVSMMQGFRLSYERIRDLLRPVKENMSFSSDSNNIEFRSVSFKYPGSTSPLVLKDFDFKIEEGSTTALVGESGCGKTTALKLILGFYEATEGQVMLGGMVSGIIDKDKWFGKIGCVLQSGHVFTGTIIENISLGMKNRGEEAVWETLELVGMADFVRALPLQLSTRLGVSGIELSGGQKQRLMIARAIFKMPEILILDEATSSLDASTEKKIVENIRQYCKGKTLIVAAHRLSTVMDADKILFIKDGKIAEEGTHDELVAKRGHYWRLVRNQLQLSD